MYATAPEQPKNDDECISPSTNHGGFDKEAMVVTRAAPESCDAVDTLWNEYRRESVRNGKMWHLELKLHNCC